MRWRIRSLEALGRLRPYLTSSAANTIYKAFIFPISDYCYIYWRSVGCTLAGKLERLQKRTARIVLREGASNDPVLQLSVHLHFQAFARIRWHRPFFSWYSESAIIIKRGAVNLMLYFRLCGLNLEKIIMYQVARTYNELSDSAKHCKSLSQFKDMLRTIFYDFVVWFIF